MLLLPALSLSEDLFRDRFGPNSKGRTGSQCWFLPERGVRPRASHVKDTALPSPAAAGQTGWVNTRVVWRWEGGWETEARSPRGSRVRGWAWLWAFPPPPTGAVGRHPFKTPAGRPPFSPSPAGFQKFRQLVLAPSWVQTLSEGGTGASKSSGLWLRAGTGTDRETDALGGAGPAQRWVAPRWG